MGEHGIEELRRQYEAARSKRDAAVEAMHEARRRLAEAICAEKSHEFAAMGGVIGVTKVRCEMPDGKPDMRTGPFFVIAVEQPSWGGFNHIGFRVAKAKKDGTPSSARVGIFPQRVSILPEDNQ